MRDNVDARRTTRKRRLPSDDPGSPSGQEQAEAGIVRLQRVPRVDNLDGHDEGEQHECDGLAEQQCPRRRLPPCEAHSFAQAMPHRLPCLRFGGGERSRDEQHRNGGEGQGVHAERDLSPVRADEYAAERRASDARHRKPDVDQAIAFAEQVNRRERGVDRSADQRARGEHEHAVDQREQEHERQRERLRKEGEADEDRRFACVEQRQHPPHRLLVDAGGERGSDKRREKLRGDEQRRRRERIASFGVDQQRQGDDSDVVARRVDGVRGQQPPEGRCLKRCQRTDAWSLVLGAKNRDSEASRTAMDGCSTPETPLSAVIANGSRIDAD